MVRTMRVECRAVRAGGAIAGQREVVHDESRDDLRALVEHSTDDRGVIVRYESLENMGTAADRNACNCDAILHADALALELARRCALDADLAHYRVERI